MKPIADIIIPIHPDHQQVAAQAIASAEAQTLPVRIVPQIDATLEGAAAARNAGAMRCEAPFIVFLDADDLLEPTFVETCLNEWLIHGHGYVFTEWYRGGMIAGRNESDDIFFYGMYHIITTLLPRKAFLAAGGFDTTMPTLEDEDLYRKLWKMGLCAWRVSQPLVHYRANLGFSKPIRDKILDEINSYFFKRDGHMKGLVKAMCACNDPAANGGFVSGEQMPGDVLALSLYTPRRMRSTAQPGRIYEAPMMGYPMWVNPNDVVMKPNLWQPIARKEDINPDVDTVLQLAGRS